MSPESEKLMRYVLSLRRIFWSKEAKLQMIKMIQGEKSPHVGLTVYEEWEEVKTTFTMAPEDQMEEILFLQRKLRFFRLSYSQPGREVQKIIKKYSK